VRQANRLLGTQRIRLVPGRNSGLTAGWVRRVKPGDGPVSVAIAP